MDHLGRVCDAVRVGLQLMVAACRRKRWAVFDGTTELLFSARSDWSRLCLHLDAYGCDCESEWVLLRLAAVSIMLLGVPAVASEWAQGGVPDVSQSALFALVPFVVVAVAMGREPVAGEEFGVRRFLRLRWRPSAVRCFCSPSTSRYRCAEE